MIAVFSKIGEFHITMDCSPKDMFIVIKDMDDIRGRKFIGIITVLGWYRFRHLRDAYDELIKRQPELK